jgi:hypothetical protein
MGYEHMNGVIYVIFIAFLFGIQLWSNPRVRFASHPSEVETVEFGVDLARPARQVD